MNVLPLGYTLFALENIRKLSHNFAFIIELIQILQLHVFLLGNEF